MCNNILCFKTFIISEKYENKILHVTDLILQDINFDIKCIEPYNGNMKLCLYVYKYFCLEY